MNMEVTFFTSSDWIAFLSRLPERDLANLAESIWQHARVQVGTVAGKTLDFPRTGLIESGHLHLSWDTADYYVDIDLYAGGGAEWFYRSKKDNQTDGGDLPKIAPARLPAELLRGLEQVAR